MKDLKNTVSESNRFGIPADELAELTEIFNLVDIDHGGSIDGDEVRQLMQTLGIQTTEEEIEMMIKDISNNSNEIQFDEFVCAMSRKVETIDPQDVMKAFASFSYGAPRGHVKVDVLERALCSYGEKPMSKSNASHFVQQLEVNKRGLFNYEEYVKMLTRARPSK